MADDASEGDRHEARGQGGVDGEADAAPRGRRRSHHEAGESDRALSGESILVTAAVLNVTGWFNRIFHRKRNYV